MNKQTKTTTCAALAVAFSLSAPAWAVIYSGSLSSGSGLTGTEQWASDSTLEWTVSDEHPDCDGWYYEYTLTVVGKGISHATVEVSDTFEIGNLLELGDPGDVLDDGALAIYGPGINGNSDPGIPDTMYGIKVNTESDDDVLTMTWSICSDRMPVWGDFYAKDGVNNLGGGVRNDVYLHNTGFTAGDTDPDVPAASGSVDNHILRPDSLTDPEAPGIPEPSTGMLGGIGLLLILRRRVRS